MSDSNTSRWHVLPAMIVRPSGFAFSRLDALRFVRSLEDAGALAAATRARSMAGEVFDQAVSGERYRDQPALDDARVRKQLSRHVKRARAFARDDHLDLPEQAIDEVVRAMPQLAVHAGALRASHERRVAAERELESVFSEELAQMRGTLRRIYSDDERLRESVFLESPDAFERIEQLVASDGPRDSRARQRERLAAMYLQRFCAKNDTNSICGPHAVAWIADRYTTPCIQIDTARESRRTYFSHWAGERLLAAAAARIGGDRVVPVRVNPSARLDGTTLTWCVIQHDATATMRRRYARAQLPDAAVRLFVLLSEQPRTVAELIQLADPVLGGMEDLTALIDEMADAGMLVRTPALPPGVFFPLDSARTVLMGWRSVWGVEHARELQLLVDRFAMAKMPERVAEYRALVENFQEVTGGKGARGQGSHYADRAIIHEDCHATVETHIGRETIEPLRAGVTALLHAASLPLDLARETVRDWFRSRFGEGSRISVLDAHRAFDEQRATEYAATTVRAGELRRAIEAVRDCFARATRAANGGPIRVTAADLRSAAGRESDRPAYASLDLMLRARPDAAPELVIGEVHGFFWLPTCLLDVAPQATREQVLAHMRRALRELAGHRFTVECLFAHTQATDRRFPLADADLLLIDDGDRESVRLGPLDLVLEGDRFRFLDGDREVIPVTIYTTYPFFLYTSQLAPLVDDSASRFFPSSLLPDSLRGDCPRMSVEDVIFHRRTWRRTAAELRAFLAGTKDAALFCHSQQLRVALGCPSVVFVSFADEPKPVLVDFDNFFLVETFAHLVERQAADTTIRITEMLPGPDELIATGHDGRRTSELRLGIYRLGSVT